MRQLQWNMSLTLSIEEKPHHYSFEAYASDNGVEVAIQGSAQDAVTGRETISSMPVFYDRLQFASKGDAITHIKNFTSSLIDKSFALPPIKLNRLV